MRIEPGAAYAFQPYRMHIVDNIRETGEVEIQVVECDKTTGMPDVKMSPMRWIKVPISDLYRMIDQGVYTRHRSDQLAFVERFR